MKFQHTPGQECLPPSSDWLPQFPLPDHELDAKESQVLAGVNCRAEQGALGSSCHTEIPGGGLSELWGQGSQSPWTWVSGTGREARMVPSLRS